jgi:hypothetical protein
MLTIEGWKAIETIQVGEWLLSRPEDDPYGESAWKQVEARFERTGRILHLHVNGQVIRTTPEHPFYAFGKGWTAAGELVAGDYIHTLSGSWVRVEEVFDTGCYEPVYNLRVADFHTYFVGDEDWGFAAWAHNAYSGQKVGQFRHRLITGGVDAALADFILHQGDGPTVTQAVGDGWSGVWTCERIRDLVAMPAGQRQQAVRQAFVNYCFEERLTPPASEAYTGEMTRAAYEAVYRTIPQYPTGSSGRTLGILLVRDRSGTPRMFHLVIRTSSFTPSSSGNYRRTRRGVLYGTRTRCTRLP